jgi:hypothetical protein
MTHKDAAIRLLDGGRWTTAPTFRADEGIDNISRIKAAAASEAQAPIGAATVGDDLERSLRPEPESNPSV